MGWQSGENMSKEQLRHILSKMKGGLGKAILSELFMLLLLGGADFMILLSVNPSDVPVLIWIMQLFLASFFTIAFFQGVGTKKRVKARQFQWREGIVTEVKYTHSTGHKNELRGLIVDGERYNPVESIGQFKEGMTVVVVEAGSERLAFTVVQK